MHHTHFALIASLWSIMFYLLKISKNMTLSFMKGSLLKSGKHLQHKILIIGVAYIIVRIVIYTFLFESFIDIIWKLFWK